MTYSQLKGIAEALRAVCVFRNTVETSPMQALAGFLSDPDKAARYGAFVASLAEYGFSFSAFLREAAAADGNVYIKAIAEGRAPNEAVRANAESELRLFSRLTELTFDDVTALIPFREYLPVFLNEKTDFAALYAQRCENVRKTGYGVFARGAMFRWTQDGPAPIDAADAIAPAELTGYAEERRTVEENLLKLLAGRPAANMLLYGEAGTGKSSTVKALVNRYCCEGLRLIELKKNELVRLPDVMARIRKDPLKFVIFTDDLSFTKNDDCFNTLKSVLEGAAGAQAENAVIAATSNRRHIIKESFSERDAGDDIHRGDTVSELLSLADRFGLTVYFGKPDKRLYLQIVNALAAQYGVERTPSLETQAEAFALKKGGRSPRAAKQFILSKL